MQNHSHVNRKSSSSSANREGDHALTIEAGEQAIPATLHIQPTLFATHHFPDGHQAMLAEGAYRRAEQRGFEPGHELDDWLAAEVELDQRLAGDGRAYR
jgi:hypothetical protein